MTTQPAVQCDGISKSYPHFQLRDIDLTLEHGTVMGLVGPNGAGKSTLLRIIMGLIGPDRGRVRVLGHSMPSDQVAAKYDIGFVSEDMRLYESETLEFHMRFVASIFPSWDSAYAEALLEIFELKKDQKIKGLSHGQRVKATLLLALARRPSLLVFDEPTTGLDPAVRREVLDEMMNSLSDETRSILFSSHNTQDVEQISDYITFIYGGQIIESRDKEGFLDDWRRVRIANPGGLPLPELSQVKEIQESGHLISVVLDDFEEDLPRRFVEAGQEVVAIERLTLEEIFLTNVKYAKRASS